MSSNNNMIDDNLKDDEVVNNNDLDDKVEHLVEQKLKEKNKEKSSKILIILLVVVLVAALLYIAYDKGYIFNTKKTVDSPGVEDNKKDDNDNKNEVIQLDLDDSIVTDLSNKFIERPAVGHNCGIYEFYTNSKVSVADLSNKLVYQIADGLAYNKYSDAASVSESQFSEIVASLFGESYKYKNADYNNQDGCSMYKYNSSTKTYDKKTGGCDNLCYFHDVRKVVNAYKDDKTLTLEVGVLFLTDNNDGNYRYYKDYNKTISVTEFSPHSLDERAADYTVDNAKKGTIYKMVFNLENGNYVYSYTEPANK